MLSSSTGLLVSTQRHVRQPGPTASAKHYVVVAAGAPYHSAQRSPPLHAGELHSILGWEAAETIELGFMCYRAFLLPHSYSLIVGKCRILPQQENIGHKEFTEQHLGRSCQRSRSSCSTWVLDNTVFVNAHIGANPTAQIEGFQKSCLFIHSFSTQHNCMSHRPRVPCSLS
jgi:hypothetical protein